MRGSHSSCSSRQDFGGSGTVGSRSSTVGDSHSSDSSSSSSSSSGGGGGGGMLVYKAKNVQSINTKYKRQSAKNYLNLKKKNFWLHKETNLFTKKLYIFTFSFVLSTSNIG